MRPLVVPRQPASTVRMAFGLPPDASDSKPRLEYEPGRTLNRMAEAEAELQLTQEDNRALRESMDPKRRATFALPFVAVSSWTTYSALTQPDFYLPGLDSVKEVYRSFNIDRAAERAQDLYYPGSLGSYQVDHKVAATLEARGYTRENTLFATSTCPDEVNTKVGELCDLFKIRYGENFGLGGLGGVPFAGKAGFAAYAHHVPDKGKMFIVFAPHVGIEFNGKVGQLQRENQQAVSTACGAAVGAFNQIMKEALEARKQAAAGVLPAIDDATYSVDMAKTFDSQIGFIKRKLQDRLADGGVEKAPNKQVYISYMMYLIVREFFIENVLSAPGFWDDGEELAVLGGVMVNRARGGDRFMPLFFQSRKQYGGRQDLYPETFGELPDLGPCFGEGNAKVADTFYDYDLNGPKVR